MGYTRKFQRSHEQSDNIKTSARPLYQRVIAAVTIAGFVLNPVAAFASEITRNGSTTNLAANPVTNLYAEKIVGDAAVNVFDKFNVTPNNIVNMYFKTAVYEAEKNNLVNFVNSRINIDGTVNAVRNNKIDGNLYFLSKDGMAVGKSGVINAGALYAATPTNDAFNNFKGYAQAGQEQQFSALMSGWGAIPVNSSGTISVLGKINTFDGINMRAGKSVLLGKDASGDNATMNKAASLRSDVADFADLVNIAGVESGLTGDLTVIPDTVKGDIVLTAWADKVNGTDDKFPNNNAAENKNLVTASVESVGTITARGNVNISATATNGAEYSAYLEDGVTVETGGKALDVWGQMVKTKADVRIDGEVTANRKMDITAHTGNYYLSAVSENIQVDNIKYRFNEYQGDPLAYTKYIGDAFGALAANEAVAYSVLGGEATVTVGKDAVITAKGAAQEGVNTLNISADSTVRTGAGASTAPVKFANVKGSSVIPSVAVTVAQIQNDASVVIDGKLESSGNTNVSANASTSLGAAATDTTKKYTGASTLVNAAVVVGVGDTNSSVTINNTVDSAGDLNIAATTANSVNTSAIVSGSEDSVGATAVNVTVYDSSADVQVNNMVTGKNVAITAGNVTKKNEVKANTGIGSSSFDNKMAQFSFGKIAVKEVKDFIGDLKEKIFDDDTVTKLNEAGNLVSVGASVAVANESNSAKVSLGKNAVVQAVSGSDANPAYGDIKVIANNIIEDTFMYASGATNNNGEDSDNKALINASVLYAEMDNSASVALEGGDANAHTQIIGKDVYVRANSAFQYNRVNRMIGDLLTLCEQLKLDYTSSPEDYKKKVDDLAAMAWAYHAALAKDPEYANSVDGNEKAMALAVAAGALSTDGSLPKRVEGIVFGPFSVPGMLLEFADPNNYANFRASSATDGKSDDGAKFAVAGSANINKLNNTAQVIVGKNSVIEGKTSAVNLAATVEQKDVALNGKVGLNSGGDTGVGGVLGLHWNNTDSLVAVAEGAQITAGGAARKTGESAYDDAALKISATNDVSHTAITFGAGKAGDVGVQAMAGYIGGGSNSLVSVDDEALLRADGTGTNAGAINLSSLSDTAVTNVAGGLAMGMTAGVGASAAITSYDINSMAVVGDNDADAEDTYVNPDAGENEKEKDAAAKMRELVKNLAELPDGKAAADIFGSRESNVNGQITAREVHAAAQNDSVINTVTVAGGVVTGDDSADPGLFDKLGAWGGNKFNKVTNKIDQWDAILMRKITGNPYIPDYAPENMQASNETEGMELPEFTVAGAGSLSLNTIDGSTAAVLDGAKIELTPEAGKQSALSVQAEDASFIGAWSGAAGISWKTLSEDANADNTSVGFGGAFGINVTDTQALAQIKASTITDAGSIVNEAKKSGALVAAGLGMALVKSGDSGQGGKNFAIAGSASVNDADNKVQALMQDNEVSVSDNNIKTQITNSAYDNDTQVTGGLNMSLGLGGSGGAAVGGTVNYADVDNIVEAKISGGNYSSAGAMDVQAVTDITQVGVAVGVSATDGDDSTGVAFNGVAAYNSLSNDVDAVIDGAAINAEKVGVRAYDSDFGAKKHDEYINARGLDATGASYIKDVSDTVDGGVLTSPGKSGNTIATGALSLAISTNDKGAGVGAAAAVNDIDNDFNAAIQNSRITAKGTGNTSDTAADVIVDAKSDTLMVGVAAGSAVGAGGDTSAGIAGSATWQNLNNDVTASIEKSDITSASTAVKAATGSLAVNVTGQVSVGKAAVGLALAQTSVENTTGAYVKDSTITANTYETDASTGKKSLKEAKEAELEVAAQNAGQQYTVAAGVGVTKEKAAVNGVVTANRGHNNVEAIVDGSTLENMRDVNVHTLDNSTLVSAAGGVGAGKGVAIGGSVAYNEIGDVSGGENAKEQTNEAHIKNTNITTANEGKIKVDAQDKSQLVTAAVGVGVSTGDTAVAVQGAAATALANKKTEASMSDVDIASYNSGSAAKADVAVTADSKTSSVTTADVAAVAAGGDANAAVGAGVAVSRSEADTRALVSGGTQNVKNLDVQANSDVSIKTVGLGGSVGAGSSGVAVQGSVAVNLINNDTAAQISGGANITADNNVGVVALSDESISNYAGTASVGAGDVGVSVGVSVSVNEINGGTTAAIGDDNDSQETKVTALGKGEGLTANTKIDDSEIHDTLIDSGTVGINSQIERGEETRKGIIVDASSTHDIKSFLVTAGVGAGTTGVGVAGTVNVNSIGGSTSAAVEKAQLNGGASGAGDAGDVSVKAGDYTNSAGFVGTVSVGAGAVGVGVGMGSDTNLVKRSASAQITDSDIKAKALALDAVSRQGISSLTVGAGVGSVGAGVAGVVTVTQLENSTKALINKTTVKADSAAVNADHLAMTNAGNVSIAGAGVGAGVGLSVGVLKDNSVTEAVVGDSLADSGDNKATVIDTVNDMAINAQNHTKAAPAISATGVAGVGASVAGATSVNNINSVVKATVNNARLTSNKGKIDVSADNLLTANAYLGADSAGVVGVGANVGVNTIDSTVQANVTNSILAAGSDIGVTAEEQRDIVQMATNVSAGGAAVGANIAVTNAGKAISGGDDNSQAVLNAVNQANSVYGTADLLSTDYTFGALKQAGTTVAAPDVGAEVGGGKDSQITVNINNANITSGAAFKAEAKETDNIKMTLGSGVAGGAAVNAGVGILNVHRNVGVNMAAADVTAKAVAVGSAVTGGAKLEVYQGSAGIIGANAAYGGATTEGFSKIDIAGSSLNGETIDILASDTGTAEVKSLGITVGAVALGAIVTEADNGSDVAVNISGGQMAANGGAKKVSVQADKANSVTAHATGGIGGAANGYAVAATAKDNGNASVTVQNGSTLTAQELTLQAANKPAVQAVADSVSVSLLGGVGTAVATAKAGGNANVTVQNDASFTGKANSLLADTANINAVVGAQEDKNTVEAQAEGNSGSLLVGVAANVAAATADMGAAIDISGAEYKTQSEEIVYKTTYDDKGNKTEHKRTVTTGATQLNIKGENTSTAAADARGVTVGGAFTSGQNVATTANASDIAVNMQSGSDAALLKGLDITATGAARNTTTADGSGGALVSGDLAAYVDSSINSNIDVNVGGKLTVTGDVKVEALQKDYADLNADAVKATVVGGSATKAVNKLAGSNNITLKDATISSDGAVTVTADNVLTLGEEYQYAVKGSGYGGVNVQGAEYDNTIDKSAAVKLQNARLTSNGAQTLAAQATGDITAGGYIKSAGLGAFTWADVDNSVTTNNEVTVDGGSSMKTLNAEQDITLSASDSLNIEAEAIADTQGAAVGGASADLSNALTRSNTVDVQGALYSMHDVNLYAGQDENGKEGKLNLELEAEAYNRTLLGFGKPKLANAIAQNNSVTVGGNADVSSVRHINLYADAGVETVRETNIMYNWYRSEDNQSYTSSIVGDKEPTNKKADNFVQLDGRLTAGIQNKQHITIGNTAGQLVFLDEDILQAVKNYGKGQESAIGGNELLNKQVAVSNGVDKDGLAVGTMDYGMELFKRYSELGELMSEYSEDKTSSAYLGYKAERERIMNEMDSLGLVDSVDGEKIPVEGMTIDYISLPDIVASGGNINIQTDTLSGSGQLVAQGSPEVTITNNTNLYLKVNDVLVGEQGGEINYNNVSLTNDNYTAKIAELNRDKDTAVRFSSFEADASTGGSAINITGAYSGTKVHAEVKDSGQTVTVQLTPKADIEINGNVISEEGIVKITSAANNIIIQGADASSSASVQGSEVYLDAAQGSVSQGYHDGITNIGGGVQNLYNREYEAAKEAADEEFKGHEKNKTYETSENRQRSYNGNMIAGGNIYINASDINVNGYIQSGYAKYELIIDAEVQNIINQIQQNWQKQGGPALSDAVVTSGIAYRIVEGDRAKNRESTTYQVAAYYNPSTGMIVVPDVDAQGGKVYLTGRISSTGSGKINVLDGAYDISVTNNTGSDLQLGELVSNDIEGLISITDTAKKTITELYRDKTIVTDLSNGKVTTGGESNAYSPQAGLRYNWTTGQQTSETRTYKHTHKAGLWGAVTTLDETKLSGYEATITPETKTDNRDKKNGEYIGRLEGLSDAMLAQDFVFKAEDILLSNTATTPEVRTWRSGFLGWFKWEELTWQRKTGSVQNYIGSVKADRPIAIGFFGNGDGHAAINVNSTGSVDLMGGVKTTANADSRISITTQGAINGLGGTLTGDNINLSSDKGMSNIFVNSLGDTVNLNAVNSGSGDVDITVKAAYGRQGNVALESLNTNSGEVSLTAQGNIIQQGSGVSVSADRIDLTSKSGTIGTAAQAITVQGGQTVTDATDSLSASVNAKAGGNIYLTQDNGDLRLGRVYSDQGDVSIIVKNGDLVDALPAGEAIDRGDTEALLQKWRDLGLTISSQDGGAGWDEKQLLYAIQDSIINPDSSATDNVVKDPNLKGNNITLDVKGSVGLNSDKDVVIDLNGLYDVDRLDDLKALTSADASSVTWDEKNKQAVINQKYPLGVQLASGGKLNVTAQDNVYLSGRTENNANADKNMLNIELVQGGNIRLQSQNGIYNVRTDDSAAIIGKDLLIQAGKGSIGGVDAGANEAYMNVQLSGALQAQAGQNISLRQLGGSAMQITSMGAGKDINLLAAGNIVSVGDEEGAARGYIKSDNGVINISSEAGSVGTTEHALRIHNTYNATQLVNVTAEKGDINLYGVSNSTAQDAPAAGSLNLGSVTAGGAVNIDVNGNAVVNGSVASTGSQNITLTAGKDIVLDGDVTTEARVIIAAANDVLLNNGKLTAGSVYMPRREDGKIGSGAIVQQDTHSIITDKLYAAATQGIALTSSNNELQNVDLWNAGKGDISLTNNGAHDLNVIVEQKNDGNITITNNKRDGANSDVNVLSPLDASGNISITNNAGNIVLTGALNGGQDISLQTDSGSMEINSPVIAADGDISLVINTRGDIFDANDNKGSLSAINGNITVTNNGIGDMDLDKIYALDNVRVELTDGKLRLYEINGRLVAVALRSEGHTMDIDNTVASTQILLNGSSMDLDDIEQRVNGDGMLVLTPSGASGDKPIDTLSIGGIKTNSGICFEHLWVKNADISIDDGRITLDKLFVEGKAQFTNKGMVTTVYGTPPVRDGSNRVYWQNTARNRPEQNLDAWLNGSGDWMYLNFAEQKGVQYSNGLLLHLQDHYYVYDQRFSGVGHLRYLSGDALTSGYEIEDIPGLNHYNRFDNYELPELVEQAAEDELHIE